VILSIAVLAALAGHTSYSAMGEWARDMPAAARLALGIGGRRGPCEATIRFTLQRVDPVELARAAGAWLAAQADAAAAGGDPPRRHIAVDGKTARGSRTRDKPGVHLLAALDVGAGVVLGQQTMAEKPSEITAFKPLLDSVDLKGAVVTADALHTQHAHVAYLATRGADWALTVKANQPTILDQVKRVPWEQVPGREPVREKSHGRYQARSVKVCDAPPRLKLEGAAQVFRIIRRTKTMDPDGRWTIETAYGATSLAWDRTCPEEIAELVRRHWAVENELHWVRDVTLGEDLSQIRTKNGPAVMAEIRNIAVSLHRLQGADNIAAAGREVQRHANKGFQMIA
jgi:predicted transposase YbfD/YdcC